VENPKDQCGEVDKVARLSTLVFGYPQEKAEENTSEVEWRRKFSRLKRKTLQAFSLDICTLKKDRAAGLLD